MNDRRAAVVPLPRRLESVFHRLRGRGKPKRLLTHFPTLDAACRGGFPSPRYVVVGGAPGTGKTTLVTQWAVDAAIEQRRVFYMAVDESDEGVAFRIAQRFGCDMGLLEENDEAELAKAAERLSALGIHVCDGGFVEDVVDSWGVGRDDVVIFDSLQTIRSRGCEDADGLKGIVDANTRATKAVSVERKCLVLCTSEISRAFYRNAQQAAEMNALAAFKESGSIEFAIETGLVLTPVAGQDDQVDVLVPKNRRYEKKPFRMELNRELAMFKEIDAPAVDEVSKFDAARRKILDIVRRYQCSSANEVWRKAKGHRPHVLKHVKDMISEGVLVMVDGYIRPGTKINGTGT